jgi:hypothetical protein
VLVVETLNPGALVRIDDFTGDAVPRRLWSGETPATKQARFLRLELAEPVRIDSIRLILDTSRVAGWNEIDAVGLILQPTQ